MGSAPSERDGLKKGPWTAEEDQKLIEYIRKNGWGNWRTLPNNAGLQRCGKSCRLRWTNYLRPDIKRGKFSQEEEDTIIHLHSVLGNKWSVIAARLPGRTDNEIKNYWNTRIRKKLLKMGIDPVTHRPRLDLLEYLSSILSSSKCTSATDFNFTRLLMDHHDQPLASSPEFQRVASSSLLQLLSNLQNQIPNSYEQNFHQNPFSNPQMFQNQIQPTILGNKNYTGLSNISFEPVTTFSTHSVPFSDDQTQQLVTEQNNSQLSSPNFLAEDDFFSLPNYGYYSCNVSEGSSFESTNFSFASVLSTPSSSSTKMNSSCSYIHDDHQHDVLKNEDYR